MIRESRLASLPHLAVLPRSVVSYAGAEWAAAECRGELRLVVTPASAATDLLRAFDGELSERDGRPMLVATPSPRNAAALRRHLPWLTPRPLGLCSSFGFGDRLGLATAGHVRAMRRSGGPIAPIFAQQSIREMTRSNRGPQQVVDAATWGAFREGWTHAVGADADHLKHAADIDACLAAGFTLFTIDPGAHVANIPGGTAPDVLRAAFEALPWQALEDSPQAQAARFADRAVDVGGHRIVFDAGTLLHAAVKYGRAIAHVTAMYRHLAGAAAGRAFELEVSGGETPTPTTPAEHVYVASELRRLGVRWVSLAPRLVGRFEKGVDYIGDPGAFEADWAVHAAIARELGPYKLSLHSGSDKFSIYAAAARQSRGLLHVKTAGTSYLEAVRTLAVIDPGVFRELYTFSRERYATDRESYHVSASVDRAPAPELLEDDELPAVLDDFHARQILHVTFGSVLTARDTAGRSLFREPLMAGLSAAHEAYAANLETHFARHLQPFAATAVPGPQPGDFPEKP
jgi:tagaturonate epimerase